MLKSLTINAITKYIEENLEVHPIKIDEIVTFTGFSRRYLQQHFKKIVGISIGKYIQLRRISRAAVLLKLTNMSIINIADRLFYDSQQTFTREFRKNTGYTPLQYRKHKTWTFSNLIGHRYIGMDFPTPDIRYIEKISINATKKIYNEKIPYLGIFSEMRWGDINSLLTNGNTHICMSNKVLATKNTNEEIEIHTYFWSTEKRANQQIFLPDGFYTYFSFRGDRRDYIHYINNVYMNILPFYGLQKRNDYDVKIISKNNDHCFLFEYYLPVTQPL